MLSILVSNMFTSPVCQFIVLTGPQILCVSLFTSRAMTVNAANIVLQQLLWHTVLKRLPMITA